MSPNEVLEAPAPTGTVPPRLGPPPLSRGARAEPAMNNRAAPRATAESMATKQRDISVSEFFAKNRHLLGFDSPRKALLTAVKEAVDNSLDACEEAGILPDVAVVIEDLEEGTKAPATAGKLRHEGTKGDGKAGKANKSSRYRVTVVDNGPGILRKQVENVFGRLLFGSKFHRLKMSRGQQGIGISAAGMYGLITTGKPMMIQTRPDARKKALKPVGEWSSYEVVVKEGTVTVTVNGAKITTVESHEWTEAGYIGFQSEGAEIHWKNIRIKAQ